MEAKLNEIAKMKPPDAPMLDPTRAAFGIRLSFPCPELVEFFGLLGFEWLFLDAEHSPLSHELARSLVRAADLARMPVLVRVPEIRPALIEGFLDVGVTGILAPNISSAAHAQALVAAVKFAPRGGRGAAFGSRDAHYGLTESPADYVRRANERTFTAALIESQQGIDQLEAILAVDGLDYIAIGANDLGLSLGTEAGMADTRVRTLVQDAVARIKALGKRWVAMVSSVGQAMTEARAGAGLVAVSDTALLAEAGRSFLTALRLPTV